MLHWFAYAVLWIAMKFWRWVVWLAVVLAMPASYLLPAFAISWVSDRGVDRWRSWSFCRGWFDFCHLEDLAEFSRNGR